MSDSSAWILVYGVGAYCVVGMGVAAWIVLGRLDRLDPVAAHGTWGFRLLVLPGLAAFWPLMLRRCLTGAGVPPVEQTAHRRRARLPGAPE